MREDERRALLRTLADDEYTNVMNVCANLPYIEMDVKTEGGCSCDTLTQLLQLNVNL